MASSIFKTLNSGDVASVRKILSMYETSVTIKNNQDHTALHMAAMKGNADMVRELLKARAPHDALDGQANTPMHLAAENGCVEVVKELLSGLGRRTVLRMKNKEGRTPLHLAAKAHHAGVVEVLIQSGACAAIKDKGGATPLELVPNLQMDDPVVQALMGQASSQAPKASASALRSSSSNLITQDNTTTPAQDARAPSPTLSTQPSKEGISGSVDNIHTRAAATAAAATAGAIITPTSRRPGSGLPTPPSSTPPPGPSLNMRSSMDQDSFARAMTPAGMRRLRATSGNAANRPTPGRSTNSNTPNQFPKSHQIKGGLVSETSTPERPSETKARAIRNGDSDSEQQDGASLPILRSEVGMSITEGSNGSSLATSRQNSLARQGESINKMDWRKASGAGELLEAHDAALRELHQSLQRVEEQQAELIDLQGKVREAEGMNRQVIEEHARALESLQERMVSVKAQEAALREVQEGVQELQAGAHEFTSRGDLLDRTILIQGEHAEQLAQSRAAMEAQSRRVEELETRLKFTEGKGRETRNRLDQMDDKFREGGTKDKERRDAQDGLLKQLQSSLARVVLDQQMQQSSKQAHHQQQLSEQQIQQLTARITEQVTQQVTQQVTTQVTQQVTQQMQQQLADTEARMQLSETEALRHRVCKLEDVGAGDQLALLQLRLQQLSGQLADGLGSGLSFSEAGARLSTLMAWYRQESEKRVQQADAGATLKPRDSFQADANALDDSKSHLAELKKQIAELRQQVESLQASKLGTSYPEPPSTPTQGSESLHGHSMSMSALSTPPSVGPGAAARTRLSSAAAAAEVARAEEVTDLRKDLKSLQGQVSSHAASIENLRGEVRSTLATVRREWEVAVGTAAVRHAEQMAEGKLREERLKSMRDAAMADDEARRKAHALETRLLQGLKNMENTLGLVQHKMEVLEEQLEEVSSHAAESSMTAENTAAELATLKDSFFATGGPNRASVLSGTGTSEAAQGFVKASGDSNKEVNEFQSAKDKDSVAEV